MRNKKKQSPDVLYWKSIFFKRKHAGAGSKSVFSENLSSLMKKRRSINSVIVFMFPFCASRSHTLSEAFHRALNRLFV